MNNESNDKKMIALQLDIDLYKQLEKLSVQEDRSLSSLIRSILKKYIKDKKEDK